MSTADASWTSLEGASFSEDAFARVWLLALAGYGVGDVVTTIALVWFSPFHVEANPIIAAAIAAFGGGGFLALKLVVIYACLGISLWGGLLDDDPVLFYAPPLVLGAMGAFATVHNLGLLI
jgi:hypothetical protein